MPEELLMEVHDFEQEAVINTIPKKKKCKKAKGCLRSFTNSYEKNRNEMQMRKKKYPFEWRVPKNKKER